jgi:hypothetical protein
MSDATRSVHDFAGKRIEVNSSLPFDEILKRLREQTGKSAVTLINEVASQSHSPEEFDAEVTRRFVGPSGFMLFAEIEHSGWIAIYGIHRRVLRIILGNPLLAITMMREDISAGLFAPVEILIDVFSRRRVRRGEHEPGHVANFILAAAGRRLHKSRLHLEDMETAEHIERKIALQCGDADWVDRVSEFLERCGGSLHRRSVLAVDRTGLHEPAHTKRALVGAPNAVVKNDAGVAVVSVWSCELGESQG